METLLASILYLMTRHRNSPNAELSEAIVQHLHMLANHPGSESQLLKDAGRRLACQWRQELRIEQHGLEPPRETSRDCKSGKLH